MLGGKGRKEGQTHVVEESLRLIITNLKRRDRTSDSVCPAGIISVKLLLS